MLKEMAAAGKTRHRQSTDFKPSESFASAGLVWSSPSNVPRWQPDWPRAVRWPRPSLAREHRPPRWTGYQSIERSPHAWRSKQIASF